MSEVTSGGITHKVLTGRSADKLLDYRNKEKEHSDERALFFAARNCSLETVTAIAEWKATRQAHGTDGAKRRARAKHEPVDKVTGVHASGQPGTHVREFVKPKSGGRGRWRMRPVRDGETPTHLRIEPEDLVVKESEATHTIYASGADLVNPDNPEECERFFNSVVAERKATYPGLQEHIWAERNGKSGLLHVHVASNATIYDDFELDGRTYRAGQKMGDGLNDVHRVRDRYNNFLDDHDEYGFKQALARVGTAEYEDAQLRGGQKEYWDVHRDPADPKESAHAAKKRLVREALQPDEAAFIVDAAGLGLEVEQKLRRGKPVDYRYRLKGRKQWTNGKTLGPEYSYAGVAAKREQMGRGEEIEWAGKQRTGLVKPLPFQIRPLTEGDQETLDDLQASVDALAAAHDEDLQAENQHTGEDPMPPTATETATDLPRSSRDLTDRERKMLLLAMEGTWPDRYLDRERLAVLGVSEDAIDRLDERWAALGRPGPFDPEPGDLKREEAERAEWLADVELTDEELELLSLGLRRTPEGRRIDVERLNATFGLSPDADDFRDLADIWYELGSPPLPGEEGEPDEDPARSVQQSFRNLPSPTEGMPSIEELMSGKPREPKREALPEPTKVDHRGYDHRAQQLLKSLSSGRNEEPAVMLGKLLITWLALQRIEQERQAEEQRHAAEVAAQAQHEREGRDPHHIRVTDRATGEEVRLRRDYRGHELTNAEAQRLVDGDEVEISRESKDGSSYVEVVKLSEHKRKDDSTYKAPSRVDSYDPETQFRGRNRDGEPVKFRRMVGDRRLSDRECEDLLDGERLMFKTTFAGKGGKPGREKFVVGRFGTSSWTDEKRKTHETRGFVTEQSLSTQYAGHRFSDVECQDLVDGGEVSFATSKTADDGSTRERVVTGSYGPSMWTDKDGVEHESQGFVENRERSFARTFDGHRFTDDEVDRLLRGENVFVDCVDRHTGKAYVAAGGLGEREWTDRKTGEPRVSHGFQRDREIDPWEYGEQMRSGALVDLEQRLQPFKKHVDIEQTVESLRHGIARKVEEHRDGEISEAELISWSSSGLVDEVERLVAQAPEKARDRER